jgi:hypothetical protein
MNLRETWSQIESSGAPGFIARRLSPEPRDRLHAAVDTVRGSRLLVLECRASPGGAIQAALASTEGYSARCALLDISSTPKLCIIIESTPETPFEVFLSLCEDVAQTVLQRGQNEDAENAFAGRLLLWRRLFENRGAEGLGYEARLGLLAEIIHLRELITAGGEPAELITWWTGPDKLATDFQSPHGRTEVKATTTRKQYKVHINGERQLESLDGRPLSLVAMMFERVVADGVSLPDEVLHTRQLLGPGAASQLFGAKLLEAGYLSAHEDSYRTDSLKLLETREYRVQPGFPRIESVDVSEGVGDLQYTIDLSACEPFRLAPGSAAHSLLGLEAHES